MEQVKQSHRENNTIPSSEYEDSLLNIAIQAISDKKGENIVSLNLKNIDEAVADYFVLCEAKNPLQIQAICQHVTQEVLDQNGEKPYRIEEGEGWTLIDYVNIVVHIFREEERKFYDLEGLWLDSERKDYLS